MEVKMSSSYNCIVPILNQETLSNFVSNGWSGSTSVRLNDHSVINLSGYRRPENKVLYIIDSEFIYFGFSINVCFEEKIVFNIRDYKNKNFIETRSSETYLKYFEKIRTKYPDASNFFYDILIWNSRK